MDRVFLDANVLFSAAYMSESRLRDLWSLPDVILITSTYAAEEARRNLALARSERVPGLETLLKRLLISPESTIALESVDLPAKDGPILAAAITSRATHLLTGDKAHFGHLFGTRIQGVLIESPSAYFRSRKP